MVWKRMLGPAVFIVILMTVMGSAGTVPDVITIDTPDKRDKGEPTRILFDHRTHADEHSHSCDACHAVLKKDRSLDEYSIQTVHGVCRSCHNRQDLPSGWSCRYCHISGTPASPAAPQISEESR